MKKAKTLKQTIEEMSDEELELYADIPAEVCREYLLELHSHSKDSMFNGSQRPYTAKNSSIPGITKLADIAGVGNRTIYDIINLKQRAFGVNVMDKMCMDSPFSLYEVTERTKEWAQENDVNWPRDYVGNKARNRIKQVVK